MGLNKSRFKLPLISKAVYVVARFWIAKVYRYFRLLIVSGLDVLSHYDCGRINDCHALFAVPAIATHAMTRREFLRKGASAMLFTQLPCEDIFEARPAQRKGRTKQFLLRNEVRIEQGLANLARKMDGRTELPVKPRIYLRKIF